MAMNLIYSAFAAGDGGAGERTLGKLHHSRSFVVGKIASSPHGKYSFLAYPINVRLVLTKLYYSIVFTAPILLHLSFTLNRYLI